MDPSGWRVGRPSAAGTGGGGRGQGHNRLSMKP